VRLLAVVEHAEVPGSGEKTGNAWLLSSFSSSSSSRLAGSASGTAPMDCSTLSGRAATTVVAWQSGGEAKGDLWSTAGEHCLGDRAVCKGGVGEDLWPATARHWVGEGGVGEDMNDKSPGATTRWNAECVAGCCPAVVLMQEVGESGVGALGDRRGDKSPGVAMRWVAESTGG